MQGSCVHMGGCCPTFPLMPRKREAGPEDLGVLRVTKTFDFWKLETQKGERTSEQNIFKSECSVVGHFGGGVGWRREEEL